MNLELDDFPCTDIFNQDGLSTLQKLTLRDIKSDIVNKYYRSLFDNVHNMELKLLNLKSRLYVEEEFVENKKIFSVLHSDKKQNNDNPLIQEYLDKSYNYSKIRDLSSSILTELSDRKIKIEQVDLFTEGGLNGPISISMEKNK